MIIQRAYRYKLELTNDQEVVLTSWLGSLRQLYNLALEQRTLGYQQFRKRLNYYDQASELGALKEAAPWMADVPHHCLQQKLKDVESAFQRFFKSNFGYPSFKKRGQGESMRFPDAKQFRVDFRKGKRTSFVKLPKIGLLKFIGSQKIMGKIKNCTISKDSSGFYISFQSEYEIEIAPNLGPAIGIDRGVRTLAMTSSGECLELPSASILKLEKKIARAQRKLAKKKKFSNNWKKQKLKVAHFHVKIGNIRKDALHKISNDITKSHGLVVIEDLKIKNMTASGKGTIDEPGKMVRQKSGLNRSILRQGWGELERQLSYKISWNGGALVKVPAPFTSQRCAACGHVDKLNRINESFKCLLCGHVDHADVNAAKNILALGHSAAVCGGASAGGLVRKTKPRRAPMKQKPISA